MNVFNIYGSDVCWTRRTERSVWRSTPQFLRRLQNPRVVVERRARCPSSTVPGHATDRPPQKRRVADGHAA